MNASPEEVEPLSPVRGAGLGDLLANLVVERSIALRGIREKDGLALEFPDVREPCTKAEMLLRVERSEQAGGGRRKHKVEPRRFSK